MGQREARRPARLPGPPRLPALSGPDAGLGRRHELVAGRILGGSVALALAGVALQTVVSLVVAWGFDREVEALLADSDESVFAWASVVATFAAALGAALLALAAPPLRRVLSVAAAGAAFLSLDDFLRIHERAGDAVDRWEGGAGWEAGRLLWPLIFLPILAALFVALWRLAGRLGGRPGRFVLAGLALLAAAVALELASAGLIAAGHDRGSVLYELEAAAEEGAELAGWLLVAGGLLAAFVLALGRDEATMPREGG